MKKPIFAIYDNKAGTWMDPFYAQNNAVARRTFTDACNDERSLFYKHPKDFELFQIGIWDDQKGTITPEETKDPMGTATDYLRAVA